MFTVYTGKVQIVANLGALYRLLIRAWLLPGLLGAQGLTPTRHPDSDIRNHGYEQALSHPGIKTPFLLFFPEWAQKVQPQSGSQKPLWCAVTDLVTEAIFPRGASDGPLRV